MSLMENNKEEDYIKRIDIALQFIDKNLDANLSLETISKVAFYSPYHFHRIFKAIIGETLNVYITRKRIEKTASILMRKREASITDLAYQFGFSSNSAFTKAFKKFYGISPSEFRKQTPDKFSRVKKLKTHSLFQRLHNMFEAAIQILASRRKKRVKKPCFPPPIP